MNLPILKTIERSADFLTSNLHPLRQPLAYVGGWLGQRNLGDEALLLAAKRLFPASSIWNFDGSRSSKALLRRFPRTSNGLFAGGTLINRAPEYLALANTFLEAQRRLYFFGSGVAPASFWEGRDDFRDMLPDWKRLMQRCDYIGVRGPLSARLLSEAGVPNVRVVGDPVVAFAGDIAESAAIPDSLGVNIGHDHGHQWGDSGRFEAEFLELVKLAATAGWTVKWFVVYPKDLAITRRLAAATGTQENIFCSFEDVEGYMRQVSTVSVFAGMKLHATILALCAFVPSLMLAYTPKGGDFMESIGQMESNVRTDQFRAAAAWEILQAWNAQRNERSAIVRRGVMTLRDHQVKEAQIVASLMASRSMS